jgi:hypothetical protein
MKCQWCGRDIFYGDRIWRVNGGGEFCSEKCANEWHWEHGGKEDAEYHRQVKEGMERRFQLAEEDSRRSREVARTVEHFRPIIEQRVGHPVKLEEIWLNERTQTWAAWEEIWPEVDAAMKRLEQESGVRISALVNIDVRSIHWFQDRNRWGFVTPNHMEIYKYDAGSYRCKWSAVNSLGGGYWVEAEDLAPLIAVAEYEGRKIEDLNFHRGDERPDYTLLPDRSYVISYNEVLNAMGKKNISPEFIPSENRFFYHDNYGKFKKRSIFDKHGYWVAVDRAVCLSDLKILIPVKRIQVQPVPAAPKPAQPAKAAPRNRRRRPPLRRCDSAGNAVRPSPGARSSAAAAARKQDSIPTAMKIWEFPKGGANLNLRNAQGIEAEIPQTLQEARNWSG